MPIAGHTPGSVVAFVRTAQHDYALIGDQAWQHEGVDIPAERPWLSRRMVDEDPETVRANLGKLHQLQAANPRLVIVPSHDRRVTSTLPELVDALGSGPSGGNTVEVRVFSWAPYFRQSRSLDRFCFSSSATTRH